MHRITVFFGSIRWPLLVYALPASLLLAVVPGSGGWLLILLHAALLLMWGGMLDVSFLKRGGDPRLGVSDDREARSLPLTRIVRAAAAGIALILAIILLFLAWPIGIAAIVMILVLATLAIADRGRMHRRRFWFSELLVPLVAIMLPLVIVGESGREHLYRLEVQAAADTAAAAAIEHPGLLDPEVIPESIGGACILFALMFGCFLLLCLLRDERMDSGAGFRTTATTLGRGGAALMLVAWQTATLIIAALGVQSGYWDWPIPVIIALASIGTAWTTAMAALSWSPPLWTIAQLLLAIMVVIEATPGRAALDLP